MMGGSKVYSTAGSCPICGSPLFVPSVWNSVLPPSIIRSCQCVISNVPNSYSFDIPINKEFLVGISDTVKANRKAFAIDLKREEELLAQRRFEGYQKEFKKAALSAAFKGDDSINVKLNVIDYNISNGKLVYGDALKLFEYWLKEDKFSIEVVSIKDYDPDKEPLQADSYSYYFKISWKR